MTDLPSRLDPAELLAQRAWMRRFAAALAGAEGEDLVQEAWVRVLSGRAPALARPRAWLAHVLRNAARMQKRGALRREQREVQAARAEALASTDELVAQAELEQLAVRTVLALPGLYRQALLLRYVRGLEPSEIARQLGLPPSTVRNRIARGLAEVRAELDRRHGRREAWLALLAPGAVVPSSAAAAIAVGGTWMSTKWLAAAAVLAVVATLAWVGRSGRPHEAREPDPSAPSAVALAAPATLASEPLAEPSRTAVATERLTQPGALSSRMATELIVHVTWERDGSPAVDVPLRVESLRVEPYPLTTTGTTDAAGTVRFAALPSGLQDVDTLRDASATIELVPGEPRTLWLAIPRGLDVDCRVVDQEGAGVAGAEVWLSDFGSLSSGIVAGRTDAGGRLALRDVPGQHRSLAARAPGHAPSPHREYRGLAGARLAVELVLPGPGASLRGLVQDASGMPVAGAEILIAAAPPRHATSDTEGSFLVHGLAPGSLELQARAPDHGTARARVELAANESARCALVLPPEARVAGVARDGSGRPLAGVHITGSAQYFDFAAREARTEADGSFVLRGLEAGRCLLGADGGLQGRARTELRLLAGEEARWDVVLTAGGTVAGVVLDQRGAPLPRWHVAAEDPGRPGEWLRSAFSDAAGRFRMEDCPAQRFVLALRAPEERWGDPVLVLEDFQVGDEALVLRALDACRPSAFVEGRLVAADGGPLVEVELGLFSVRMGAALDTHVPDADGRFRIGPLRSGEYVLGAEAVLDESAGLYPFRRWRLALQAGETRDLGNLVLERGGWVRLRAVAQGGAALPPGTLLEDVLLRVDGQDLDWISFVGAEGRSGPLAPGTYLVRSREGTWRAPDAEVEVRPGETTELELVFEPTTERLVEVVFPEGEPASLLELSVLDAGGRAFDDLDDDLGAGRYSAWVGGLLPGSYTVEARAPDGRSATGALHVLDLAADETPLVLTLR